MYVVCKICKLYELSKLYELNKSCELCNLYKYFMNHLK